MPRKIRLLIPAFLYYVFIFILSSQPRVHLPISFPLIDKVLHLILYTGFGVCLAFGLAHLDCRGAGRKAGLMAGLGILLGGLDEIHQMFVPGRSADVLDAAVDVLGVIAGWLIFRVLARRAGRRFGAEGKTFQP